MKKSKHSGSNNLGVSLEDLLLEDEKNSLVINRFK
jgi:hypothetical protein